MSALLTIAIDDWPTASSFSGTFGYQAHRLKDLLCPERDLGLAPVLVRNDHNRADRISIGTGWSQYSIWELEFFATTNNGRDSDLPELH
jgi:hypothetical protein